MSNTCKIGAVKYLLDCKISVLKKRAYIFNISHKKF